MKLTSRATVILAAVTATILVPAIAYGAYTAGSGNPGNTVAAGVLKAPGTLTATAHVPDNATNAGDVTLTWNDGLTGTGTLNPAGYLVERQLAGLSSWQTVSTPSYAGACNAGHVCTVTDATAAFNSTYSYRVRSTTGGWTAGPTNVRLAASVAPAAAEDRALPTDALASVAYSASGLIAVGKKGRILVCSGTCTGTGAWQMATSPTGNDLNRVVFDGSGTGRAWVVGAAGTVLTCASGCLSPSATWTTVNAGTTAALYGITANTSGGYVAVVGANRTMRSTTDSTYATWQTGTVNPGTTATTLYGIAAKSAKSMVVVGTGGVVAGCSFTGGGSSAVCGASSPFTTVGYAGGTSAPAVDMRDVSYVNSSGDNVVAVGAAGNVYASTTSLTAGYTKKATGTTADLYAVTALGQNAAAAVGDPVPGGSSVFLRCTSACAGSGTWAAGADTGTTSGLAGLTGTGSTYWAAGSGGTIRYLTGTSWTGQSPSSTTVSPALLRTGDGSRYALATASVLTSGCTAPALVATASVPARSSTAVTSPTVKVTIGYVFNGGTNASQVALSTDNGGTWSVAPLTGNVAASTAKTVDFTGTVPAADSAQQILLCVQGTGGAGRMNVDLVHVDVEE